MDPGFKTSKVRTFLKVSDAASDSDDEDKLHIVEEDGNLDATEEKPNAFKPSSAQQLHKTHTLRGCSPGTDALIQKIRIKAFPPYNCVCVLMKEECVTDEENEKGLINESLWQGKTCGVICPDVPKEEVYDENVTLDEFSQLHSCPYCSRGYKRRTSLKEHIKLRHKKNNEDLCCSICSYTFSYRTQLDQHMNAHKNGKQRIVSHLGTNRKFKCTECSKAFKYKHHLKEHLRIHSGEKPYECSNCKKRFSHSGSYSSHISSRKCVAVPPAAKAKVENNKPLGEREQLLSEKIKEEPDEHKLEAVQTTLFGTTNNDCGSSIQTAAPQGVVQTLVLPTVGLVQPITINLKDLQNMLKLSVDGNMLQAVGSANGNGVSSKVVNPGQPKSHSIQSSHPHMQVISAISLPVLNQDGNSKVIINYSVDSQVNTSALNTTQSILSYQTTSPVKGLVDSNRVQPEPGEFKSAQYLKLVDPNTAQLNVIPIQKPPILKSIPTQISIIKSTQSAVLNKAASIIKVTKLIPGQTKPSQPTVLLLRTVNGPQGLVVRQLAAANPQVTDGTTNMKAPPENTIMAAEKHSVTEPSQVSEETSTFTDRCQPEDLRSIVLQGVQIKTEASSKMKEDCKEVLQIQKGREGAVTAHRSVVCGDGFHNYATCLICDNSPSSTEQGSYKYLSSLLGDEDFESSEQPPVKSLLSLLEAYSKDSHASEEQLSRVAESVNLPRDVVSRWFQRMRLKNIPLHNSENLQNGQQTTNSEPQPSMGTQTQIIDSATELHNEESFGQKSDSANYLCIMKKVDQEEQGQTEPLDLSLSTSSCLNETPVTTSVSASKPFVPAQEEPLNLTNLTKNTSNSNTIFVTQSTSSPINIIATPLQTLVAIAEPGGIPCLKAAVSTKQRTILIPQLSYTYTSSSTNGDAKTITTPKVKDTLGRELGTCEKETDTEDESGWKGLNDSNLLPVKKRRKLYGGQYACDLCDKYFQKSSSLLRHKYEHTGKRPHECGICKKAFKHKHHLIEHSRLHSGEKPYQCDKCGKRFSHSGSYSQHMNHRYSYCKKVYQPNNTLLHPQSQLHSDERESDAEEELDDYQEAGGEKDDDDFSGFDMSDIRVVRIGEEYDEEEDLVEDVEDVVKTLGMEDQHIEAYRENGELNAIQTQNI